MRVSVCSGTAVLVTASVDVDKSGASYYGEQNLHYLDIKGEGAVVQLREYTARPAHGVGAYTYITRHVTSSPDT